MIDPLAEVVALLQPAPAFSKVVGGAGRWRVHRAQAGQPFYCAILEGSCRLTSQGEPPLILEAGDFVLIPSPYGFTMSSLEAMAPDDPDSTPVALGQGEMRIGEQSGPHDVQYLVGHCVFGSPDAALLVSLLPKLLHVRGERRLATLVELVREESRALRPARDVILARLLEVLFIEALRSTAGTAASPGILRGLADERLTLAIRRMHETPAHAWTVVQLAKEAALSRSAFFARFHHAVGMAPMAYLLAWRMALGKDLLRRREGSIADVAQRVGYGSASAFSVAFTRHVGLPPTRYAREQMDAQRA
jgi:AraC-like DNA-binding protein